MNRKSDCLCGKITWTINNVFLVIVIQSLCIGVSEASNGVINVGGDQSEPSGLIGGCRSIGSGVRNKLTFVTEAGQSVDEVMGIDVLACRPFDGPGGTNLVDCPPGSKYAYCLKNSNDGLGNHVELGVVVDRVVPTCRVVARRQAPVPQLDIAFEDKGVGIENVGLFEETNVQLRYYSKDGKSVVLTAIKIRLDQSASFGAQPVDMAGNVRERCDFKF